MPAAGAELYRFAAAPDFTHLLLTPVSAEALVTFHITVVEFH